MPGHEAAPAVTDPTLTGKRYDFLGAPVDCLSFAETIAAAEAAMRERRLLQQVCLNVAKFVAMRSDAELDHDVRSSHLVSIDGMGVVWAARLFGIPVGERVAGIDLFEGLMAVCAAKGYRPYFLGARPDVLQKAIDRLSQRHPGLAFAGARNGYFAPNEEPAVVAAIRAAKADCLFIGMPTPRKEQFLRRYRDSLGVPFLMGVGGSFDVAAGEISRAPAWAQAAGLEWFWRMAQEPLRLAPRYMKTNLAFAGILAKAMVRRVFGGANA